MRKNTFIPITFTFVLSFLIFAQIRYISNSLEIWYILYSAFFNCYIIKLYPDFQNDYFNSYIVFLCIHNLWNHSSNVDYLSFIFIWQVYLLCFVWNTVMNIFIHEDLGFCTSYISVSTYFLRVLSQRTGITLWLSMHCNIALQNGYVLLQFHLQHLIISVSPCTSCVLILTFWFSFILVDMKYRRVNFWHIPTSDISKTITKQSSSILSRIFHQLLFFPITGKI